jgi:flagellar protein FliL
MSSAAAAAVPAAAPSGSKKKLIIIIAAVLVLALGGGGAAMFMMKSKAAAAAAAEDGDDAPAKEESHAEGKKVPPVFVPLDPFTVNLADQDAERYAQIGVTLQIDDAHVAEELKLYMPAIRNGVLMVLSHKTAKELADRAGKEQLADEIMKEAVRPLGIDLDDEDDAKVDDSPKKKKKKKKVVHNPIKGVFFSSFIVQ